MNDVNESTITSSGLLARLRAWRGRKRVLAGVAALSVAALAITGVCVAAANNQPDEPQALNVTTPLAFDTASPSTSQPATPTAEPSAKPAKEAPAPADAAPAPEEAAAPAPAPAAEAAVADAPAPQAAPANAASAQAAAPAPSAAPAPAPVAAAPAPAPAPRHVAPAPRYVAPAPAPAPAPQPGARTEGLNQSLGTINAHRVASGVPAFVPLTAACSPMATAIGTALDSYQHQDVVLGVFGRTTGASFSKGANSDTLTVYRCS